MVLTGRVFLVSLVLGEAPDNCLAANPVPLELGCSDEKVVAPQKDVGGRKLPPYSSAFPFIGDLSKGDKTWLKEQIINNY
jgi:hypothetical protein